MRDIWKNVYVTEDADLLPYMKVAARSNILVYLMDTGSFPHLQNIKEKLVAFGSRIDIIDMNNITIRKTITNGAVIEELTGVPNYDAHEAQIKEICNKIFRRSYGEMRRRAAEINNPDTVSASTNFIEFLDHFESPNTKWITIIQNYPKER